MPAYVCCSSRPSPMFVPGSPAPRGPKSAVPIRTSVAPSAMADSKSALMPIDSVSSLWPLAFSSSSSARRRANTARAAADIRLRRRYAHQAAQADPRQLGRRRRQPADRAGLDTALVRFRHQLHLNAQVERRCVKGSLFRQPPGDAESVDAVHPIEAFGDGAGLVGLNAADEMPAQLEVGEPIHLGQGLLKVVFTEIRDARRGGHAHRFGSLGLGDGNQGDRGRVSPGCCGGPEYPRPDVVHMKRRILRTN